MTLDELKNLKIWSELKGRRPYVFRTEEGDLSDKWEEIKELIKREQLVLEMVNTCFGFGCGIVIHQSPAYPNLPSEKIQIITCAHFDEKFDDGWQRFHPLVSSRENLELLHFCRLPTLKSKGYYEY